jgi:hypothetical protein
VVLFILDTSVLGKFYRHSLVFIHAEPAVPRAALALSDGSTYMLSFHMIHQQRTLYTRKCKVLPHSQRKCTSQRVNADLLGLERDKSAREFSGGRAQLDDQLKEEIQLPITSGRSE